MKRRFARTAFYMGGGLLVWAADFLFAYVFTAVACARGFARLTPWIAGGAGIVSFAAAALLACSALKRLRGRPEAAQAERFIDFVAFALAALALWGIALTTLPPVLGGTDCRPQL